MFQFHSPWNAPQCSTSQLENFSAFSARLFAAGTNSLSAGCAIERAPFAAAIFNGVWKKPLSEDFEPYACAAMQWVLHAGAQLFEMCTKKAEFTRFPSTWEGWQTKFERVASAQALSERSREMALWTLRKMEQIERDGVSTNVVEEYGLRHRVDSPEH